MQRKPPNPQKKYREKQSAKGLVRYEIQVDANTKKQFEALVEVAADEMPSPWSLRQRMAQARARIFDEVTKGVRHEFYELQDRIRSLRAEIKALSPNFFTTDKITSIPEAIQSLPDNPVELKRILAKTHSELLTTKSRLSEAERLRDQYSALYDAQSTEFTRLQKLVQDNDIE